MCKSTDSGIWAGLSDADLRRITGALRGRRLHLTAQRRAVCEAIFGCPGHICAEHVLAAVGQRHPALRMNKTTVYRNLGLLVELGLVAELRSDDGPTQYEPAARGRHSHLLCDRCGALDNLDAGLAAELARDLRARYGFAADLEGHPIVGRCARCLSREAAPIG